MKKPGSLESITSLLNDSVYVKFGLLFVVATIFTLILYPSLLTIERTYAIGDVAENTIKASFEVFIEDEEATELKKKSAVQDVITVYDHHSNLKRILVENINEAFDHMRFLIPQSTMKDTPSSSENRAINGDDPGSTPALSTHEIIWQNKKRFEELMGLTLSDGAFRILLDDGFSFKINQLTISILTQIMENGVVANKEILLKEHEKGIILRNIDSQTEKVITNLKTYYGLDQAKTMVRVVGDPLLKGFNYSLKNLVVDMVQRLVQPNITLNINETELRKIHTAQQVKPILYRIIPGEMVLREGERVTKAQLVKLKALAETQGKEDIVKKSAGGAMIFITILILSYVLMINIQKGSVLKSNKSLLFLSCILITFFVFSSFSLTLVESVIHQTSPSIPSSAILFGIPLAAAAMIVCIFMGLEIAIPFAMIMALFTGVMLQNRYDMFLFHLFSGTMAAFWIKECRERKAFITAGLKIGMLNILLSTIICIYSSDFSGTKLFWSWVFAFMSGIGAGIITSGMSPLVEMLFEYTTDITLLEIANLDRPILRRLMLESPGTYHHSVIVGSLVEAAASEIGSNPLLAKVCGYYHDIGKINKPLYFIENQFDGQNRHNKLAPSMSSLILISHVKDGVEIAKKNKLGQPIIDMIREHHGTSLISFFYEKAKQLKGKEIVKIDDFRYPGPKPQSIEAALVMLADVVEASSRTLEDPTPSRIQGHVQTHINKIFADGQLDNCELTLKDLHNIAKSFIKILTGIYHHRIDYPEKTISFSGKAGNGSSDRQPAKQIHDATGDHKAESTGGLKRLGLP
ncbi:MAG: HDIG domain-containing protein [Desulfobacteraceae bacterium]|nr:HDIG domain-containing protein [Desulfobacteraceae bacterium]MBU4055957.1 HDIG domain-containing protein [Pseudomonadota bacterium]